MTRRCARWWFLRGLYIGQVAGLHIGRRQRLLTDVRWLLRFWRDLGRPSLTRPEGP